jgi:hypothetical protein
MMIYMCIKFQDPGDYDSVYIIPTRSGLTYWLCNPVHLISSKAHSGCDRSAEDAYSSAAPDPTFAFVGGPCCLTLDFVFALWIMITFYTLLTSLFCTEDKREKLVLL